jgi:hypothetical protein
MKAKYTLEQLVMMQDALDAMDDTSCLTRADFVEVNKPSAQPLYAAAWDEAKELIKTCGSIGMAATHVAILIDEQGRND